MPEPEPKPEPVQPKSADDGIVDEGPMPCVSLNCRSEGLYRSSGYVCCEKHMRDSVRSWLMATKETAKQHPVVLYCPDGFNTVRVGGREEHMPLGEFERVQICQERGCKNIFRIERHWTGEPMPCPECRRKHWQEYQTWLKERESEE
jgi:hypothetical protein